MHFTFVYLLFAGVPLVSSFNSFAPPTHPSWRLAPGSTAPSRFMVEANLDSDAPTLSEDERRIVQIIYDKSQLEGTVLKDVVLEALPTMNPNLIMKLRGGVVDESREAFQAVSKTLEEVLEARLMGARDTLKSFLQAGEIRKLDSLIGNAARNGNLDVAFFQVLNMNLEDAASQRGEPPFINESEKEAAPEAPDRFQILQHIYTRCQEEVENTIPPGVALLNKLLRTEQPSIRKNQLQHYLCPKPNVIKTPDGKELKLEGREKILVQHSEFVDAIGNAVKQIRTVEKAGGANRMMAANMVESCRQVAMEARIIIGEEFGRESEELLSFEECLQPVFRPSSQESEYIVGEASQ